jgi:hypothetical protein
MRRVILAGTLLLGLAAGMTGVGLRGAVASEPYEKVTGLKCEHCHKHTKEEFKAKNITGYDGTVDYKECGKEAAAALDKVKGYKKLTPGQKRTPAETKKWADALADSDWKCKHQKSPGQKLP